jgi:hypothetical protein
MSRTMTMPHDYNRQVIPNETEKKIDALPYKWYIRCINAYFGSRGTVSQAQALLQIESEMDLEDECRCCLPEQTCAACSQPATSDVELPYQEM